MHRRKAVGISAVVRRAIDAGRWVPTNDEMQALTGLECALALNIQAGQPRLEAMQAGLIAQCAETVLGHARSAASLGAMRLTMRERRTLKVATLHVVPDRDRDTEVRDLAA